MSENQELVSQGIYRRIHHPIYLELLVYSGGQALVIPNWIAGPAYFVALVILFASENKAPRQVFGKRIPIQTGSRAQEPTDALLHGFG